VIRVEGQRDQVTDWYRTSAERRECEVTPPPGNVYTLRIEPLSASPAT
jgi:hypothetical protein